MDEIIRAVRDCPSGALSLAFTGGPEERDLADWHGRREPAIEITRDGPYRVTGRIALIGGGGGDGDGEDGGGGDGARAEGSSREHYALCRCGHSQNKPFCSGMHWYIGFTDPEPADGREPSLFEWAGGLPALSRMTRLLYEKLVPADALLAPLFAGVPPGYPEREAARIAAGFGGPPSGPAPGAADDVRGASQPSADRDPAARPQAAPEFTAEQQARWISLASQAAGDAGLPADAEFRAALAAFFAWDAPAALARAAGRAQAGGSGDANLPAWDWTAAGPPDTTPPAAATGSEPPVTLPGPDEPVSFAAHIKPMFRAKDRQSMQFAFDLWSYDDVRAHSAGIVGRLGNGTMPCDGAWPSAQVDVFRRWTESGTPR